MMPEYYAEKKDATVLFCDIRNFTHLFEAQDPLKAVQFANTVLARLGEEVEAVDGTVDRFTGDGFLAHFGVRGEVRYHARRAAKAALNMRGALQEINRERYANVEHVVSIGMGIHSGVLAYGEIKTKQISQKTILGDVVNTAARIEALTKYFSVDILVSKQSYQYIDTDFHFQQMPAKKIQGKEESAETYWLLPTN